MDFETVDPADTKVQFRAVQFSWLKCKLEPGMDFETVDPADFGASLTGIGINLLVRDVLAEARFLTQVFQMQAHRSSADFAIMQHQSQLLQLHSDGTYFSHPLLDLLPENPPRGAG